MDHSEYLCQIAKSMCIEQGDKLLVGHFDHDNNGLGFTIIEENTILHFAEDDQEAKGFSTITDDIIFHYANKKALGYSIIAGNTITHYDKNDVMFGSTIFNNSWPLSPGDTLIHKQESGPPGPQLGVELIKVEKLLSEIEED
jgi:hypothetical protein